MLQKLAVSLPQAVGQPTVQPEHLAWATTQVNLFFGSFRKADADDPETFTAGCLRLFTAYPPPAVQYVVDPLTGLPGRSEWLPTMKAIKDALDAWQAGQRRTQELEAQQQAAARQIAERKAGQEKQKAKPTLEEMQAKHGPNWGLAEPPDADERMRRARLATITEAGRQCFEAECAAAGVDPRGMASPSLIAAINAKRVA